MRCNGWAGSDVQASFSPTSPAAGVSQTTRRSLPFSAQSVTVSSGANFVTILPDEYVIAPGQFGVVYPLSPAQTIAAFRIQAPIAGVAPLGPSAQQTSTLEYSDSPAPASSGTFISPPAQQTSIQNGTLFHLSTVSIFTGLAKTLLGAIAQGSGNNVNFRIDCPVDNTTYTLIPSTVVSSGVVFVLTLGQGTNGLTNGTISFTGFLPQRVDLVNLGNVDADYEVRLLY